ncbi:hypothetical protein G4B88_018925 [Cannabis sativa]|uniref:Uncharacterized protein n=1 Tax=Cannabis sativa TaxID=3483 RepID=A0A7J6FH66_CANSA|nr:hypothetical protein G4B88_016128 [Cannabis sativa]KAF4388648.1 hypothetical protein G4B88_018925 [Cannabis sativa]
MVNPGSTGPLSFHCREREPHALPSTLGGQWAGLSSKPQGPTPSLERAGQHERKITQNVNFLISLCWGFYSRKIGIAEILNIGKLSFKLAISVAVLFFDNDIVAVEVVLLILMLLLFDDEIGASARAAAGTLANADANSSV